MRLLSILIALVVTGSLYLIVFERDAVMEFAGNEVLIGTEGSDEDSLDEARVSVVAMASEARAIDTAVVTRGRTEARRQVEMRAETTGRVISQPLRRGSFVEEGAALCRLDPGTREVTLAEARARLAEARARQPEAQARIAEAEAGLTEARINQNAASSLSEGGFASETRVASSDAAVESALAGVEAARSGLESASAGVQSAEAAIAAAETELDRLVIHAPFAGLLESDTAEIGALLQPGSACATVIQLDPIKLVGFVPETSVDRIAVGARARARLASGTETGGQVTFLSRSADPETRTFRVEVEAPNGDLAIRDGQTAEILIESDGREAHLLPQSALTLDDDGNLGVRVVAGDGTALFRPVEMVRDTADGVFVGGLGESARVIVVGQEYVSDGVPLDVTMRDAAGGDGP
ncbi:efflux RND transporter periplasmic adaptor subunit [Palleronia sp. LCG004]|uniref:efflux RND transporter periplasmic adaptor subunit n=1 Tax=Palleronia sp. LCG004 TaxID=3079304 RepID=UPI00294227B1|nr:efflux RND transporter periplasmic adaptor subunit [Palleronia sp. LCG004]WOI54865.1 efflux RND transporter periplasmic adaptor subunit [Palleronia sp. LCG004]